MNKRSFLKALTGVAAGLARPTLVSGLAAACGDASSADEPFGEGRELMTMDDKLHNWAGNLEYGTQNLFSAKNVDDVRTYVKTHDSLKVLGSRHSFNNIADSTRGFLSLKPMAGLVALDAEAGTVTVDGGMTYGQLCPLLDAKGFALHNLASLPHISIAGACSTATHGSGEKNGNLATAVIGLEIVTASGDVLKLTRAANSGLFEGAVVGLGALGAITKLTLAVQPRYVMRQYVYENMPLRAVKEHFDAIESSAYSVSLFTDWQNERFSEVWIKTRVAPEKEFAAGPDFFGGKLAAKNLHPIAELGAENCTAQMGVPGPWYERLPHFRMGFTPSAGKELQSEYFVPRPHAVAAILAVEKLKDQISPHLLITEIRAIAADNLWMSPCYQQDCVTIHFTWKQDWPTVSQLLPLIEKELAPFAARPHWGKLFATDPAVLRGIYGRMPAFIALTQKLDPQGKFRNAFLTRNLSVG